MKPLLDWSKDDLEKLIADSYSIHADSLMITRDLYDSAYAILAHNGGSDPQFIYANSSSQALFEYSWEEFRGMPSRLSAPPAERKQRKQLLAKADQNGLIQDYSGVRIAKSGRLFMIQDVSLWNLIHQNEIVGQAALIKKWVDV